MSTGADCVFYEKAPGKWWYKLQCYPYGYTEDYDHYGPFTTRSKASEHLSVNHANPGGSSTDRHPDHVHTYTWQERYGQEKKVEICTGCDDEKPIVMACGCTDYHKSDCDEYQMNVQFKITVSKARQFFDGDDAVAEQVREVVAGQIEFADKNRLWNIERGW